MNCVCSFCGHAAHPALERFLRRECQTHNFDLGKPCDSSAASGTSRHVQPVVRLDDELLKKRSRAGSFFGTFLVGTRKVLG
jgi:hypothetical protein